MLKKLFALGMATIMALGTTMSACAAEPVNPDTLSEKILVSEERVPVQDEDGNTFYVVISEYVDKEDVKIGTHGIFPEYEVGTKKTFTVKIDNGDLGNLASGATISAAVLKQVAKIASAEIAKKIGTAWIPGLNAASTILTFILIPTLYCVFAFIHVGTAVAGKNGVRVIVNLKYSSVYIHKEGHDMYGWDITGASMGVY